MRSPAPSVQYRLFGFRRIETRADSRARLDRAYTIKLDGMGFGAQGLASAGTGPSAEAIMQAIVLVPISSDDTSACASAHRGASSGLIAISGHASPDFLFGFMS